MAIDLFEMRTMLAALDQRLAPKLFLRDFIFTGERIFASKTVDIDIRKGKRRIAPYVNPLMPGKLVERIGYSTRSYDPPYLKPKMVTTALELLQRPLGQHVYSGNQTAGERAAMQLGRDLAELNEQIDRREEQQCADALDDGIVTVSGEGIAASIDFGMASAHKITLSGTDLWTDTTNSNPLKDLRDWRRLNIQDSGINSDIAIMGTTAYDTFMLHPKVQAVLNFRRADQILFKPEDLPNGATFRGRYDDAGMDIFTYDEWYRDDSLVEQPMVPVKKVWVGSTRARAEKLYGAIQDVEVMALVSRFPKSWVEKDPSAQILMLQSAPLMSLHQVDAFISAQVVA